MPRAAFRIAAVIGVLTQAAGGAWAGEPAALRPVRPGACVGFLTHPHMGGLEPLAEFPANAELANVFVWRTVNPNPTDPGDIAVDFGPPKEWLGLVYQSSRVAYPILDTAIHHTNQAWRQEMTRKAGQNLVDADGSVRDFSSLHSPLFRRTVFDYVDQLIDWVRANDPEHRIAGYVDGAEWFYPGMLDYSPLALDAFRAWLQARYGDLDRLNAAWGSGFAAWEDAVPPRAFGVGHFDGGLQNFSLGRPIRVAWSSPRVPASPGAVYRVSADAELEGVPEWMCAAELHWFNAKGEEFDKAQAFCFEGKTRDGGTVQGTATAPEGTVALQVTPVLTGPGKAAFRSVTLQDAVSGERLIEMGAGNWTSGAYGAWGTAAVEAVDGKPLLTLEAPAPPLPFGHTAVALEDWIVFCYEAMAGWLNDCARHIKARDPERPVASYVGFVFATHSSWDYAMTTQRLDISLANSPDLDVNALQVCAAGDDLTYPSCPVDIARKYGKPVWSYDLVDFPYGLFSGFEPIYRASMASVQHGSKGIQYCEWAGPPYDYQYATCIAASDLRRMLTDVEKAVAAVEGYALETNVAFLMPLQSFSFADEGGYKGDMLDNGGLYHLVLDLGLTPDVYTPYEAARRGAGCFEAYDVLFLPDCPVLAPEAHAALAQFVQRGGVLVASGRLPRTDLAGKPLADITAPQDRLVRLEPKAGRNYWGPVNRVRKFGNTPPVFLATDRSEEHGLRQRHAREALWQSLDKAGVQFPARLDPSSGNVHMAVYRHPDTGERLFFLVHKGPGRVPNRTVTLQLAAGWLPAGLLVDLERKALPEGAPESALRLPDFAHTLLVRAGRQ